MRISKSAIWLTTLVSLTAAFPVGCSDVGDNTSTPPGAGDAGSTIDATTSEDGAAASDDATGDDATTDATGSLGPDSAVNTAVDSASSDDVSQVEPDDTGTPDDTGSEVPDSSTGTGSEDTGAPDVTVVDLVDASKPDATVGTGDAGPADGGADAGSPGHDAGVDAGSPLDAGNPVDAGSHDAGSDAGVSTDAGSHDAGGGVPDAGGLVPCTTASQTNCVTCFGSPKGDGVCSATKALIVEHDIANGNIANGQLKPFVDTSTSSNQGSCYACLMAVSCLDDNVMDTGLECSDTQDLPGAATGSGVKQCLDTLSCIFKTDCQGAGGIAGTSAVAAQENINLCYCGGNHAGSACQTAGAATNGVCVTEEAAGFGFAFTDNKDILANFSATPAFPSGMANQIFNCAVAGMCSLCK